MLAEAHLVVTIHFCMKQMKQKKWAGEADEVDEISRFNISLQAIAAEQRCDHTSTNIA